MKNWDFFIHDILLQYIHSTKEAQTISHNSLSDFIACYMFQHLENHHQVMKNIYKKR